MSLAEVTVFSGRNDGDGAVRVGVVPKKESRDDCFFVAERTLVRFDFGANFMLQMRRRRKSYCIDAARGNEGNVGKGGGEEGVGLYRSASGVWFQKRHEFRFALKFPPKCDASSAQTETKIWMRRTWFSDDRAAQKMNLVNNPCFWPGSSAEIGQPCPYDAYLMMHGSGMNNACFEPCYRGRTPYYGAGTSVRDVSCRLKPRLQTNGH